MVYTMVYTMVLGLYHGIYILFWLLHIELIPSQIPFPGGHATKARKFMFSTVPDGGGTQDDMSDWSA
jgi:hypothetical protein